MLASHHGCSSRIGALAKTVIKLSATFLQDGLRRRTDFTSKRSVLCSYMTFPSNRGGQAVQFQARGPARPARQRRAVANYIEKHFADRVPLTALARIRSIEPAPFLSAFEAMVRSAASFPECTCMERAKLLLAIPFVGDGACALELRFGGQARSRHRASERRFGCATACARALSSLSLISPDPVAKANHPARILRPMSNLERSEAQH